MSTPSVTPIAGMLNAVSAPDGSSNNRLSTVLGAISSALATIPDTGRPDFITGIGAGARDEEIGAGQLKQPLDFRSI